MLLMFTRESGRQVQTVEASITRFLKLVFQGLFSAWQPLTTRTR